MQSNIDSTKLVMEHAMKVFDGIGGEVPSGIPYPDGVQRIKNASRELSAARAALSAAHGNALLCCMESSQTISLLSRAKKSHNLLNGVGQFGIVYAVVEPMPIRNPASRRNLLLRR
jgi:hypothetical protein